MKKNVAVVKFGDLHFFITKTTQLVASRSGIGVRITDGLHNNGGWHVHGKLDEVLQKLEDAYNSLD